MIRTLLRLIRALCQRWLERLDPVAETPTIPPPAHVWTQAELIREPDLAGVERVLTRWAGEGIPGELLELARTIEVKRRLHDGVRVTGRGGQA